LDFSTIFYEFFKFAKNLKLKIKKNCHYLAIGPEQGGPKQAGGLAGGCGRAHG
jgi:hypothetical protein